MQHDLVVELREKVFARALGVAQRASTGNVAQMTLDTDVGTRMAIGYSVLSDGNYRLEMRVYREDKTAHKLAQDVIAEVGEGEANYEILPQVQVSPKSITRSASFATPTLTPGEPLEIGIAIQHADGGPGTLGCFVQRDGSPHILSASHVLAPFRRTDPVQRGDPIYHTPQSTGNTHLINDNVVGMLQQYVPMFSKTAPHEFDAATARIGDNFQRGRNVIPLGRGYPHEGTALSVLDFVDNAQALERDATVAKIGKTTGYTTGLLRAIDIDNLVVDIPGRGNVVFDNVLEIRSNTVPFTEGGDSGALVFLQDSHQAFGINFAGGERKDGNIVSYCCRLDVVLNAYAMEFTDE